MKAQSSVSSEMGHRKSHCGRIRGGSLVLAVATLLLPHADALAGCLSPSSWPIDLLPEWKREREVRGAHLLILDQAWLVAAAAEQYAEAHGGQYPPNVASLLPFLPGGLAPVNPFTCTRTALVDGAAGTPGEIGYRPTWDELGNRIAGAVNAFGKSSNIVTLLVPRGRGD